MVSDVSPVKKEKEKKKPQRKELSIAETNL